MCPLMEALSIPVDSHELLDRLSALAVGGYGEHDPPAAEPTALAAIALAAGGRCEPAREAAEWLVAMQRSDGSVGVRPDEEEPKWPTSLAISAWKAVDQADRRERFADPRRRAVRWLLGAASRPLPRDPNLGHDTTLVGWPWADGTHAWVEPTAFSVLALRGEGHGSHPRVREAIRLIWNRQLPDGGWNYGNTKVLGSVLRPHVQPTGVALTALGGTRDIRVRAARSIRFLRRALEPQTSVVSLAWGIIGLAAVGEPLESAAVWLGLQARLSHNVNATHRLALLTLASLNPRFDHENGRQSSDPSREAESHATPE